jgi:NADPH:quinone reductase-like Zn-dependent oxidoreductase
MPASGRPDQASTTTSAPQPTMQAVVHERYGAPDVLALKTIDRPRLKDDEVLVRVRAAALHVGDCFGVSGAPLLMRLTTGLLKPKRGIPGFDVAGQVESVGKDVTQFRPGDEVFGVANGSCAEYASASEAKLALKPEGLTFEQAAALATSGLAALRGLRDPGKLQPGQRVLINGAAGGVGTFAVQLAQAYGADVTAVCSTSNVELVRSLGADHVIDYTREDFAQGGPRYDVILDNVENRPLSDCRRALTPRGTLVLNSGTGARGIKLMVRLLKPLLLSPFLRQSLRRYLAVANPADLAALSEFVAAGKLTPVVGKTYTLADTAEALRHIQDGHARGKTVIRL